MDETEFQFFYFIYSRRLLDTNCLYKNTACSILCTFYDFGDKKAQKGFFRCNLDTTFLMLVIFLRDQSHCKIYIS